MARREFLRQAAATSGLALGAGGGLGWSAIEVEKPPQSSASRNRQSSPVKTVLSFYVDDTNPYIAGVQAFKDFLDFVAAEGIAGESSVILGFDWEDHGLLSRPTTDEQRAYIEQLHRAYQCGIDSHMELMTHGGLLDFRTGRAPAGTEHEGIWLYEPHVSVEEYESYFGHIVEEGERIGVRFTGVTWPGCSCAICDRRFGELFKGGPHIENPNLWKALLNLAKQRKFRGPTVPCFILGGSEEHPLKLMAGDGPFGVYDLYPNAGDYFGIWENNPARVNADYYITANGESGRMVEKILTGAPRCVFYTHWQGVNPGNGVGWKAFQQVVYRIRKYYDNRVVWMRPSALTNLHHNQMKPLA
jgi:hypothetical protein